MKHSDKRDSSHSDDDGDESDDANSARRKGMRRNQQTGGAASASSAFRLGVRVERELDGLWFPATIVAVDDRDGTFELEYDEDHNRETDIGLEELRLQDESQKDRQPARPSTGLSAQQRELLFKDSLLLQATDYDPTKRPTVVVHHQGESNAGAGYIINGLENNIAAGNGLRGIRWLRVNTF